MDRPTLTPEQKEWFKKQLGRERILDMVFFGITEQEWADYELTCLAEEVWLLYDPSLQSSWEEVMKAIDKRIEA